ncbi:hypothetical protein Cgig2_021340 [Carnegiea gigantea]|uniref:Uncharacterized protein n=1 Tax=Carnegiea gigantea TaxID=171969 RepID=A0A9Q1GUT3_9CARY|nr:hypothetical protein Cgig2_021340 [Carnegiea gigantea]
MNPGIKALYLSQFDASSLQYSLSSKDIQATSGQASPSQATASLPRPHGPLPHSLTASASRPSPLLAHSRSPSHRLPHTRTVTHTQPRPVTLSRSPLKGSITTLILYFSGDDIATHCLRPLTPHPQLSGNISVPIDVDSNGEEVNVAEIEVDSRHARNTTTLRTSSYKPLADALTPVEEMNVDDFCGDVMKLHLDDGGDGEVTSKFSSGSGTTPKSGVGNC